MAHYEEFVWEGTLTALTRRERTACAYRSYIPDPLVGRELLLPADLVADLADAERAVAALQASDTGLASVESVARLLLRAEAVGSSYIEGLQINARRLAKEAFAKQTGLEIGDERSEAVPDHGVVLPQHLAMRDLWGVDDTERQVLCDSHPRGSLPVTHPTGPLRPSIARGALGSHW